MKKLLVSSGLFFSLALLSFSTNINAQVGPNIDLAPFCTRVSALPTLQYGSTNTQAVKNLQDFLVHLKFMTQAEVNTGYGIYGIKTAGAVSNFNTSNGILANDFSQAAAENRSKVTTETLAKMKEIACAFAGSGTGTGSTSGTSGTSGATSGGTTGSTSGALSINLKANGSDGPVTISPAEPLTLSWTGNSSRFHGCRFTGSPIADFGGNLSSSASVYPNLPATYLYHNMTAKTGTNFYPAKSLVASGGEATYTISCDQYDANGYVVPGGSFSDSVKVKFDPTPFTLTSPRAGQVFRSGDTVPVSWVGADWGVESYVGMIGLPGRNYTSYSWLRDTYFLPSEKSFNYSLVNPAVPGDHWISFRPSTYPAFNDDANERKSATFQMLQASGGSNSSSPPPPPPPPPPTGTPPTLPSGTVPLTNTVRPPCSPGETYDRNTGVRCSSGGNTNTGGGTGFTGQSGGGTGGTTGYTPPFDPEAPVVTVSITPSSVSSGGATTITWSAQRAQSCTSDAWTGVLKSSGSKVINPVRTRLYTVTCLNTLGKSGVGVAAVTVPGVGTLSNDEQTRLDNQGTNTSQGSGGGFAIGDTVRVRDEVNLNVRSTPSITGSLLGRQSEGAPGTITEGPTSASGYTWWKVDYVASPDGWSVESYLIKTGSSGTSGGTGGTTPATASTTSGCAWVTTPDGCTVHTCGAGTAGAPTSCLDAWRPSYDALQTDIANGGSLGEQNYVCNRMINELHIYPNTVEGLRQCLGDRGGNGPGADTNGCEIRRSACEAYLQPSLAEESCAWYNNPPPPQPNPQRDQCVVNVRANLAHQFASSGCQALFGNDLTGACPANKLWFQHGTCADFPNQIGC